jgi:5'-nucleotidase
VELLITNDDGMGAPGLQALIRAVEGLGRPTVVAPVDHLSGCGHRVTTDGPIRIREQAPGYAVAGTPADCVRVGLAFLAPQARWVVAGINCGANLGADVFHSGTVAAVREAALHGCVGIALSHYKRKGMSIDWDRAARWAAPILADLMRRPIQGGQYWNVNFPHLEAEARDPEVVSCRIDPTPLPLAFRREGEHWLYDGDYHARGRANGCDVDVCFGGRIAVTRQSLF